MARTAYLAIIIIKWVVFLPSFVVVIESIINLFKEKDVRAIFVRKSQVFMTLLPFLLIFTDNSSLKQKENATGDVVSTPKVEL